MLRAEFLWRSTLALHRSASTLALLKVFDMKQVPLSQVWDSEEDSTALALGRQSSTHVLSAQDVQEGQAQALLSSMQPGDGHTVTLVVPMEAAAAMLAEPTPPTAAQLPPSGAAATSALAPTGPSTAPATLDTSLAAPLSTLTPRPASGPLAKPSSLPGEGSFLVDEVGEGGEVAPLSPAAKQVFTAAEVGDVAALEACLDAHGSVAATWAHPRHGGTPLHVWMAGPGSMDPHALSRGLQALLAHGADVHAMAGNGSTPLHWAAGAGAVEAVEALLEAGADPCAASYVWRRQVFGKGSGQTPLHWAAESGHTAVVEVLVGWRGAGSGGWRGSSAPFADAFASPGLAATLLPDERGVLPGELAAKSGFESTAAVVAATASQPFVAVQVTCRGQHVGKV